MNASRIHLAVSEGDFEEARTLSRAWVNWYLKSYPEFRDLALAYFKPAEYEKTLAELPIIHARPKGAVLLADLGGPAVGCVMYLEKGPGVAEIKRFFVDEAGRGHNLGRRLLEAMLDQMRDDGYEQVMFFSGLELTHARRLYERVGFKEMPLPDNYPAEFRDFDYSMERTL